LHVVDLDGAAQGQPVNSDLIGRIRAATTLHIEVGGGMRSLAHVEQVLATGVDRVILGTIAITDRPLLQEALTRWKERIVVGLDARSGWIAISGWRETSQVKATELATELSRGGVQRFIYTDIARDGVLGGPNISALRDVQRVLAAVAPSCALIASGGVGALADLRTLAALGVEGAIVGKAFYTGHVDLTTAIHELEREQ
jgi:phosphoribosylformimino-5-aminoimidazole carboxamide ribotide isomerase